MVAESQSPLPLKESNITRVPQAARKKKRAKLGVNKENRSIKTAKTGVRSTKTGQNMVKNRCTSTKISEIWEKMGNLMPFERVMKHMETYGDLQPAAQSMKTTLWVPSENLSFGLHP